MPCRTVIAVLLVVVSLPQVAAGQQEEKEKPQSSSSSHHEVTMANMRSQVRSLVILGWDDFFLTKAQQIGLTSAQEEKLGLLRLEFLAASAELEQRIQEAELELYNLLDRDQVLLRDIEFQARWAGSLRSEMIVLRLRYLLRAINVLSHEQHVNLTASGRLHSPSWEKREPRPLSALPQGARPSMFPGSRLRGPFQQVYPRPFPGGGQP